MSTWKNQARLALLAALLCSALATRGLAEDTDKDDDKDKPKCNYLDEMGKLDDLSIIHMVLVDTGVLPDNTQETATLLLPNLMGFINFLMQLGVGSDEFARALKEDDKLRAQVDSVLMMHVLLGPNLNMTTLAANETFPTATSLIFNDSRFDLSFRLPAEEDGNLGTVFSGANADSPAEITEKYDLCGLTAYLINKVLLPLPWNDPEMPLTEHWMINDLFANLTAASFVKDVFVVDNKDDGEGDSDVKEDAK